MSEGFLSSLYLRECEYWSLGGWALGPVLSVRGLSCLAAHVYSTLRFAGSGLARAGPFVSESDNAAMTASATLLSVWG